MLNATLNIQVQYDVAYF